MVAAKGEWGLNPSQADKERVRRAKANFTSTWFEACEHGQETRLKQLLQAGQDVNEQDEQCGWPALYYAAWKNWLWMAEWLLENGADTSIASGEGDTPVHIAARYGHADILKLLVSKNAVNDRNEFGKTPLDLARQRGHWECVGILEKSLKLPLSPEVMNPPKPLPKNWLEGDYGNGKKFYYNPFTGATTEGVPPKE
mmetsp:Transcript_17586/g.53176  ORF Transcript_17586/g.53176 Transcript_17586/m.53176 type:complete len:197 (-) Transcript_17586:278-868(-)